MTCILTTNPKVGGRYSNDKTASFLFIYKKNESDLIQSYF